MQTSSRTMVWLGVGLVAGFLSLSSVRGEGGDGTQGFYFRGGIGPQILHQTDVTEFFGPRTGIQIQYDVGLRVSAAAGYQFCKYFSADVESGILYNSIKSISGSPSTDASVAHVPLMANAVFYIPFESSFVPYCGFGFGGSTSLLSIDHATIAGSSLEGDDADLVWAGQAFAGFRYEFNHRMGIGLGYRFLAAGEPSWEVSSVAAGSGHLRIESAQSHSFLAEFTLKF